MDMRLRIAVLFTTACLAQSTLPSAYAETPTITFSYPGSKCIVSNVGPLIGDAGQFDQSVGSYYAYCPVLSDDQTDIPQSGEAVSWGVASGYANGYWSPQFELCRTYASDTGGVCGTMFRTTTGDAHFYLTQSGGVPTSNPPWTGGGIADAYYIQAYTQRPDDGLDQQIFSYGVEQVYAG